MAAEQGIGESEKQKDNKDRQTGIIQKKHDSHTDCDPEQNKAEHSPHDKPPE